MPGIFHEEQDPYGSLAGSAVATALGLAAAALGTEVRNSDGVHFQLEI